VKIELKVTPSRVKI